MASPFTVELSTPEPPAEAQARAASDLTEPARIVGLRLTKRAPGELQYKPRVQWPFLVMLWRNITGEKMTVKFEPGESGGTRVCRDLPQLVVDLGELKHRAPPSHGTHGR